MPRGLDWAPLHHPCVQQLPHPQGPILRHHWMPCTQAWALRREPVRQRRQLQRQYSSSYLVLTEFPAPPVGGSLRSQPGEGGEEGLGSRQGRASPRCPAFIWGFEGGLGKAIGKSP